ncbi:hypothetical protein Sste5346_001768 [Sporothrix stenoceras]|uniref:Vacuolar ATPase assembly protein VMA22 n=1 Tax=Sporothrix stenoceras TaxID=5173 RepID=A0ABR3ZNE4_9PEZI
MTSEHIDGLLARYLGLLHEYTELRSQLSTHQSSMFGNLARANFSAERGFRYGPDHFDGRMQALVRLSLSEDDSGSEPAPSFAVTRPKKEVEVEATDDVMETKDAGEKKQEDETDTTKNTTEKPRPKKSSKKKEPAGPRDPLQWFGVLTPMALRQAQSEAIEVIDNIVPRLTTLSAEMAAVEIEVRRARKKRAKALGLQEKEGKSTAANATEAAVPI